MKAFYLCRVVLFYFITAPPPHRQDSTSLQNGNKVYNRNASNTKKLNALLKSEDFVTTEFRVLSYIVI